VARIARIVVPGVPHHCTQRGNRRSITFFGSRDYAEYLTILKKWAQTYDVAIWSYCLMPNHVHLITVPSSTDSLAKAIGETHRRYTLAINQRQQWRGHLWQGRFFSYPLGPSHLLAAARYIELNPVRAGMARRPEDWPWSSAKAHLSGIDDEIVQVAPLLETCPQWQDLIQSEISEREAEVFQRHTRTGLPLGDPAFQSEIASSTSRPVGGKKRGRPSKVAFVSVGDAIQTSSPTSAVRFVNSGAMENGGHLAPLNTASAVR